MRKELARDERLVPAAAMLLAVFVVSAAACSVVGQLIEPGTQPPVAGAQRYRPPARYATFWKTLEGCARRKGDFSSITWFKAPVVFVDGVDYQAYWFRKWNRVVLRSDKVDDDVLIKHEMMHALVQTSDHPLAFFDGPCGKLI
jgi:hypothetical protein